MGEITQVNMQACSLFGYQKIEMLGRNVKILMPAVYSKHHDSFIENYISSFEGRILGSQLHLPIKTKTGYIKFVGVKVH